MVAGSNAAMTFQMLPQKETSPFKIFTVQLTIANLAQFDTDWASLIGATQAITLGELQKDKVSVYDRFLSGSLPTDNFARRENKLLIRYHGASSGDKFTVELPAPDNSVLTFETGDANFVVLADAGVMASFVTAFQLLAKSPNDGTEAILIDSVQYVGRNL